MFIFVPHSRCWFFILLNIDWLVSRFTFLYLLSLFLLLFGVLLSFCYHLLILVSDLSFIIMYKVDFYTRLTVQTFVTLYCVVYLISIDISVSFTDRVDCLLDAIDLLFEVRMLVFIKDFAHVSFIRHCYLFICFSNSFINNLKHLKFWIEITLRKLLWYLISTTSCSISLLLLLFISIHVRHICHELRQMLIENSNSWGRLLNYFT